MLPWGGRTNQQHRPLALVAVGTLRICTSRPSSRTSGVIAPWAPKTITNRFKTGQTSSRLSSVVVYDHTNSAKLAITRQIRRLSSSRAAMDHSSSSGPNLTSWTHQMVETRLLAQLVACNSCNLHHLSSSSK